MSQPGDEPRFLRIVIRIPWPYKFEKAISLTKCLYWCCIAAQFIQYCYLSSQVKSSSNHEIRRILTGIEAKCEGLCRKDS